MRFLSALITFCCALLCGNATTAATHYVDLKCTNSVSPYTSWTTAATNIQTAVLVAAGGETVLVTNGIYQTGGVANSGSNRVWFLNPITLRSVNGPLVTTIEGYQVSGTTNGVNAVRCVYMMDNSTLSGFTLTNGATQNFDTGGGVKCVSLNSIITNCIIAGNSAHNGGGGAYYGTLKNCILTSNSSSPNGSGSGGGGAYRSTLINCLLTRNFSGYTGGAASFCTLINCTVVSNSAASYAGSMSSCTAKNSIIYYNFSNYTNDDFNSGFSFTNCCMSFPPPLGGVNNFSNPPAFANLSAGDFHLNAASPCIDGGNNSFITNATDFDGNARVIAGTVDIGAYEFQSPVRYVNISNTAPVSPFTKWISAATNIQDAVDVANAGDFILVSNGIYSTGGRVVFGAVTNRVVIDKAVTVQSVNGPAVTVIAGFRNASIPPSGIRGVYLTNGASLFGFTLTNGAARTSGGDLLREQSGAGAWCEDNSVVLSNCVFSGNSCANSGGGVFRGTLLNCYLTNNAGRFGGAACSNLLVNCTLIKNFASQNNLNYGGGAYGSTLSNCLVVANSAVGGGSFGGGAAFSLLTGCVVSNNFAGANGGGLYFGASLNCLVSSNRAAQYGGGAYSNALVNCMLKNNLANDSGGGAYGGILLNCTVVSNTAYLRSGGIYGGSPSNSTMYYNFSPKSPNYLDGSTDGHIATFYCCTVPYNTNGFGNITNAPLFVNLAAGDFHLQSNSPCINAGNNSCVTNATDFDGSPRIVGGTVDIGAYEFQTPASTISYAYLQQYGLPTDGSADNLDSDGDGFSNTQEWRAGTNPNDASSLLKMSSVAPTNDFSSTTITWQSVVGVNYFVQRGSDLSAQPVFTTVQSNIVGQTGTTSFMDTTVTNSSSYFYRVGVQ